LEAAQKTGFREDVAVAQILVNLSDDRSVRRVVTAGAIFHLIPKGDLWRFERRWLRFCLPPQHDGLAWHLTEVTGSEMKN
jgi:hypothetical protein